MTQGDDRERFALAASIRLMNALGGSDEHGLSIEEIADQLKTDLFKTNGLLQEALREKIAETVPGLSVRYRAGPVLRQLLLEIGAKIRRGENNES